MAIKKTAEYKEVMEDDGLLDRYGPDNPKPVRLSPERVLQALMDEVDECPVSKLAAVRNKLQGAALSNFLYYFRQGHRVLLARMNARLGDVVRQTREAREKHAGNEAYAAFTSGTKLLEVLDAAKDVKKVFYKRRVFGLLGPADIDDFGSEGLEETAEQRKYRERIAEKMGKEALPSREALEAEYWPKLQDAKDLMRDIKQETGGVLSKVFRLCEARTLFYISLVILTRFGYAVFEPLKWSMVNSIMTHATEENWQEHAFNGCVAWFAIFCIDWWVTDFVSIVCTAKATSTITIKLRNQLFAAIMRQDTVFFETHDTGWIQDRLKSDCTELSRNVLMHPVSMISQISQIVGKAAFLYYYAPQMAITALTVGFLAAIPMILAQKAINVVVRKNDRFVSRNTAKVDEILNNILTVREFGREAQEAAAFQHAEKNKAETSLYIEALRHVQWPVIVSIMALSYLANVYEGARLVHLGELKPADVMMIVNATWWIIWCCKNLVDKVPQMLDLLLPAERVFRLLGQRSSVEPMPEDVAAGVYDDFKTKDGGIEFEFDDVAFAYPTMPEHFVLNGLSLHIPAGKTVSLVGERGCGKSTTLELMQRKYNVEPGNGTVRVNGKVISEWNLHQLRRRMSVVAQKPTLFTNTIKENILYGLSHEERAARKLDGEAGTKEIIKFCKMACCWDFIKDFPLQLETRVGTKGIKLSGGQTQCLTIARALIKQPACLILDEATAALDNETQKKVSANISALQKKEGFTVVQIAHRLTTLTNSDIIYCLSHGFVVEAGGVKTQNGSAVEELNEVEITYGIKRKVVRRPASSKKSKGKGKGEEAKGDDGSDGPGDGGGDDGDPEQKLLQGHFHHLWNLANDVKPYHEMSRVKLAKKKADLEKELEQASIELTKKNKSTWRLLQKKASLLQRSVAVFRSSSSRKGQRGEKGGGAGPRSSHLESAATITTTTTSSGRRRGGGGSATTAPTTKLEAVMSGEPH